MPLYPAALLLWSFLFLAAAQWQAQRSQEERVLKSESLAHEARLRMLRYQLNPHFLFNALNSNTAVNINWRSGAAFEKATTVLGPRIAKFGAKFDR